MPHLRNAVYENIIASSIWQEPIIETDIDSDFENEYVLNNNVFNVFIKPNHSGSIFEFDLKPYNFNITNTIKRHKEFYHTKIMPVGERAGVESIHSQIVAKDINIENDIFYDKNNRYSFVDHIVEKELTLDEIFKSEFNQVNELIRYNATRFDYSVHLENKKYDVRKVYTIDNNSLVVDIYYNPSKDYKLYEELNFTFLSAFFDKQTIINEKEYKMDSFVQTQTDNILFIDNYKKIYFNLSFTPTDIYLVPVYSVSLSESGVEKLYQQTCLFVKCIQPFFSLRFNLL